MKQGSPNQQETLSVAKPRRDHSTNQIHCGIRDVKVIAGGRKRNGKERARKKEEMKQKADTQHMFTFDSGVRL